MTDVSMSPAVCHEVETCAGGGPAAPGVAGWLGLAAAPTFALMALWTGFFSGTPDMALHGNARLLAVERDGGDVFADERLPFVAVAETDETALAGMIEPRSQIQSIGS